MGRVVVLGMSGHSLRGPGASPSPGSQPGSGPQRVPPGTGQFVAKFLSYPFPLLSLQTAEEGVD